MTALERPAGRPACGARPAGAREGRGTGTPVINPAIIRAVLEYSETHTDLTTAVRFGVTTRSITRWRARRSAAADRGELWPTDIDVAYWKARQPVRAVNRERGRRWARRRILAGGPLFIDATGTRRRLRALVAIGWRYEDLAARLHISPTRVGNLARAQTRRVHRDTAARVNALYDQLSMTIGPSALGRRRAAERGWLPPLAWDDLSIDNPARRPPRRRTADIRQRRSA